MKTLIHILVSTLPMAIFMNCQRPVTETEEGPVGIHPWPENPYYLAWDSTPVFPLGPTGYHSWTPISRAGTVDSHEQLERLAGVINAIGSPNVCGMVRCLPYDPMNHMHDGPVSEVLQPWIKMEDGRYDLERFDPLWEGRLHGFLSEALGLRIIVSLEVWDDWSVTRGPGGAYDPGEGAAWNAHPFNPLNNINYDETAFPINTSVCNAPFYNTIPTLGNITLVLRLQQIYVEKLLSIVSEYPNVLISIANESRATLEWSRYWAAYVRERIPEGMMIGEMPSTNRKDGGGECEHAFNPMTLCTDRNYDYVDISQAVSGHEFGNNPQRQVLGGSKRIIEYRKAMEAAGTSRPLIVSKDYTRTSDGGDIVLWGRFMGGAASARFHRLHMDHPESVSQFQHEAVGRLGRFIAQVPFWDMHPMPDFVTRLPDGAGAVVLAEPENHYVVQLIGGSNGGKIVLDLPAGPWGIRWIDPSTGSEMAQYEVVSETNGLELEMPAKSDHWIIHIERKTTLLTNRNN